MRTRWERSLAVVVLANAAAFGGLAHAGNGIVESQMTHTNNVYVGCLGEAVDIEVLVTVRHHEIELQNGRTHFVDNWFFEGTLVGVDSGNTWYGRGVGPGTANGGDTQFSGGFNVATVYKPLDDGPKLRERQRVRFVVDGNGVPRVEHFEDLHFRCIGG